jgi:type II secretory pathway component PulF
MFLLTFIFYGIIIFLVFSVPQLRQQSSKSKFFIYGLPALTGLLLSMLTVLKVFFLYKILILVFGFSIVLLTLGQLKGLFKRK